MKQNRWTRIASLLLALCLMMSVLPLPAQAEEAENQTIDFVLLIDYSQTMNQNDREGLAVEACKMFLDLIPIVDARVSVIAFGYEGNEPYVYSNFTVTRGQDHYYVHEITEMEGQLSSDKKEDIKASLDALAGKKGLQTPIGAALAAGVDTLIRNGATDGSASVIMLSDGSFTSTEIAVNNALTDQAISAAKAHNWPIYCIELDYNDWNENGVVSDNYNGRDARALMDRIVTESGAGAEGRMKVNDSAQVSEAFMKIFADVWGGDTDVTSEKMDENGVVEKEFEIPKLVSEATIAISSDCVDYVELISEDGTTKITGDVDQEKLIVTKEGSYMCIKMICPDAGTWKVRVYGDPNAEIVWYKGLQQEMNLKMVANATGDAQALTKLDYIDVQAFYTYEKNEIHGDDIYQTTMDSAKLIITNSNGVTTQFDMEATLDGYTARIPVIDIPSGAFTAQVRVQHTMFRSGSVLSNTQSFKSENLPLEYVGGNTDRTGYVNGQFEIIDLPTVFKNPDGDKVAYELSCTSDRNFQFAYEVDESDYLIIDTGMEPGVYEMEVTAQDPDMAEALVHKFTLTVEDRAIAASEIPDQDVWIDYFSFLWIQQDPANLELSLDMNEYFSDPDGVELVYSGVTSGGEGAVSARFDGSVLHVEPTAKGEVVISFQVSDGVSTIPAQVEVDVVSGRMIYIMSYGWIYLAILIVLIIMGIAIWVIISNKRVKGIWDITAEVDGLEDLVSQIDIGNHIAACHKSKFFLYSMMDELCGLMPNVGGSISRFFDGTGAEQILFGGVYGKKGCAILKVPASQNVSVSCNGIPVKKNTKMNSGEVTVLISLDDGSQLFIRMRLQ